MWRFDDLLMMEIEKKNVFQLSAINHLKMVAIEFDNQDFCVQFNCY